MSEEGRKMLFMIGVVEDTGKSVERKVHGEFVSMEFVTVEVSTKMFKIMVKKLELFSWRCLPGEKTGSKGIW